MHDFPALIWIVLVVIGVISSISKNARKARSAAAPPFGAVRVPPAAPAPAPQAVMPPVLPPVGPSVRPRAAVTLPPDPHPHPASPPRRLFENKNALVRGIIAAEVLGKPRAERLDELW